MNLGHILRPGLDPECPVCGRRQRECMHIDGTPQPVTRETPPGPYLPVPHDEVWMDRVSGQIITPEQAKEPGRHAQLLHSSYELIPVAAAKALGLTVPAEARPEFGPVPGKRHPREDRAHHLTEDR